MVRALPIAFLTVAALAPSAFAQGPVQRAGEAIDNAGRSIRRGVDNAVARGQITAQEREVLNRVTRRIEWDKQLTGSAVQVEVQPGGAVVLRGSVPNGQAKRRAVDLVDNTVGVTAVVDELMLAKAVQVIEVKPAVRVIEVTPVPTETRVIVKP